MDIKPTSLDSEAINNLNDLIKSETSIPTELRKREIAGSKGHLTIAIEIITLMLTSISTLITVLEFWNNKHPEYSLKLKVGDTIFTKDNLSKEDFENELKLAREVIDAEILIEKNNGQN